MDSLRAMFPDLDQQTLEATLEAHNNSVERTVDYLLSAANTAPSEQARSLQVEHDAALARRLQAEQDAADGSFAAQQRAPGQPGAPGAPGAEAAQGLALPSMADVQNAVKPIVDGVQYAGRVAAQSVQSLYRDFVGNGQPSQRNTYAPREEDESVVLRGEAASPGGSRATQRQRRPMSSGYTASSAGKKDA